MLSKLTMLSAWCKVAVLCVVFVHVVYVFMTVMIILATWRRAYPNRENTAFWLHKWLEFRVYTIFLKIFSVHQYLKALMIPTHRHACRHLATHWLVDKHSHRQTRSIPFKAAWWKASPVSHRSSCLILSSPCSCALRFHNEWYHDPCAPPGWEKVKRETDMKRRRRFACKRDAEAWIVMLWSLKSTWRLKQGR